MILNNEVSEILWLKTVKTACYLLNQLLTSVLKNNKVSIQLLFKSLNKNRSANSIDFKYLQCFECTAYVYISKKIQTTEAKFELWSNKKILVEYKERNQYRVWLSEKKKADWVIRARDVQFDKDSSIYNIKVAVSISKVTQFHTVSAEQEDMQLSFLSSF